MVFTIVTIIFVSLPDPHLPGSLVTLLKLPMSFMAAFFTIDFKEFPHNTQGNQSLSISYVSKYMCKFPAPPYPNPSKLTNQVGIGLAISIPLIAIAFAVDNLGQMIKNVFKSMIGFKNSTQERFARSRQNTQELEVVVEMEMKRSGETMRPGRASYETDESRLGPMMRTFSGRTEESWKRGERDRHSREWNGGMNGGGGGRGSFSRDLERGQGVG